jgi:short-subunit dehydrogenase
MFAQALRLRLRKHHVKVTLVSPGFIDTPMSRKVTEPKPFLMTADKAAAAISRRVAAGAATIVVPWQFRVLRAITDLLPRFILHWALSRS